MGLQIDKVLSVINLCNCLFYLCVGFDTPIDFKEGALSNWLENSQSVAAKVLEMYSHQFYVNDFGLINPLHEAPRASAERTLQSMV